MIKNHEHCVNRWDNELCNDLECEFIHTSCEGERYVFTFEDVDMKYGFLSGR